MPRLLIVSNRLPVTVRMSDEGASVERELAAFRTDRARLAADGGRHVRRIGMLERLPFEIVEMTRTA